MPSAAFESRERQRRGELASAGVGAQITLAATRVFPMSRGRSRTWGSPRIIPLANKARPSSPRRCSRSGEHLRHAGNIAERLDRADFVRSSFGIEDSCGSDRFKSWTTSLERFAAGRISADANLPHWRSPTKLRHVTQFPPISNSLLGVSIPTTGRLTPHPFMVADKNGQNGHSSEMSALTERGQNGRMGHPPYRGVQNVRFHPKG
jgi:hypothetical protein